MDWKNKKMKKSGNFHMYSEILMLPLLSTAHWNSRISLIASNCRVSWGCSFNSGVQAVIWTLYNNNQVIETFQLSILVYISKSFIQLYTQIYDKVILGLNLQDDKMPSVSFCWKNGMKKETHFHSKTHWPVGVRYNFTIPVEFSFSWQW